MSTPFKLSDAELVEIAKWPGSLIEFADWHEVQATLAGGMDMQDAEEFHTQRKAQILAEAARLQKEMEG